MDTNWTYHGNHMADVIQGWGTSGPPTVVKLQIPRGIERLSAIMGFVISPQPVLPYP